MVSILMIEVLCLIFRKILILTVLSTNFSITVFKLVSFDALCYEFSERILLFFQIVEEVSFAANGITASGIKSFDGVLQANIVLKTLNLSGNPIGDEGVKVSINSP